MNQGSTQILRPVVVDDQGDLRDDFQVSYSSLDESVARITQDGSLTALGAGFSTIAIQAGDRLLAVTASVSELSSLPPGLGVDGLAVDRSQRVFLAAPENHVILLRDGLEGENSTYAGLLDQFGFRDGPRSQALFDQPSQLAIDQGSGVLFLSDRQNHSIRMIEARSKGRVSTLAGSGEPGSQDGVGEQASFREPAGIALDSKGSLWVADSGNQTIRRINPATAHVETIAGLAGKPGFVDGRGGEARFNSPLGVAVVPETLAQQLQRQQTGQTLPEISLLVADSGNGVIRQVFESGEVRTLQAFHQTSPSGSSATTFQPVAVGADRLGNLYFADRLRSNLFALFGEGKITPALEPGSLTVPRALVIPSSGRLLATSGSSLSRVSFGVPQITQIEPQEIRDQGGEEVTIEGFNFAPETQVIIGGQLISAVELEDTSRLSFETPRLKSGLLLVTLQNRGGLAQTSLLVKAPLLADLPPGFVTTVAGGSTFEGEGTPSFEVPMRPVGLALDTQPIC